MEWNKWFACRLNWKRRVWNLRTFPMPVSIGSNQTIFDSLIRITENDIVDHDFYFGNVLAGRPEENGFADSWMWLGVRGGMLWIHYLSFLHSGGFVPVAHSLTFYSQTLILSANVSIKHNARDCISKSMILKYHAYIFLLSFLFMFFRV